MTTSRLSRAAAAFLVAVAVGAGARADEFLCYALSNFGAPDGVRLRTLAVDADSGAMRPLWSLKCPDGFIYAAVNRAGTRVYGAFADPARPRGANGALVAYAAEGAALRELGRLPLPCGSPCHVSLDREERALVFADYGGAVAGVAALAPDGSFDESVPVATVRHAGSGPRKDRQDRAHAHCAFLTPDNRYLGVCDLGLDKVVFYDFARWRDGLAEVPQMTVSTRGGAGPRHAAFSRDGRFMFLVNELDCTVSSYRYDGTSLECVNTLSTLPPDFKGESICAAVKVTADGSVLMASNRGHDSIALFSVDAATGELAARNIVKLAGSSPRDFELAPGERFAIVGHKKGDEVRMYRFDRSSFSVSPVGDPLPMWKPLCFKFGARVPGPPSR